MFVLFITRLLLAVGRRSLVNRKNWVRSVIVTDRSKSVVKSKSFAMSFMLSCWCCCWTWPQYQTPSFYKIKEVSIDHLRRMWCAEEGALMTCGPVPSGTCIYYVLLVETDKWHPQSTRYYTNSWLYYWTWAQNRTWRFCGASEAERHCPSSVCPSVCLSVCHTFGLLITFLP